MTDGESPQPLQPPRWPVARLRLFGGGAWIIAAGLAVGGTFAPLLEQRLRNSTTVITAWGAADQDIDFFPDFGIPIVVAAVLIVIAAALALTSTRLHPASAPVLAARMTGTGAAGLLIGSTATLYLVTTLFIRSNGTTTTSGITIGLGMWLMVGGSVVALVGSVLMLVPKIGRQDPDPETPPMGIPIVRVLEPEFEEQPEEQKGP
jgi:hypothetical protein